MQKVYQLCCKKQNVSERLKGLKYVEGHPELTICFFADDSLILMRARESDARELRHILEVYERASG